jgi:glycosyltransferase involved in cell wall biosynthesis
LTPKGRFDVTYATIDSVSEGVGSSQIVPLVQRLARAGLSVSLISFEKTQPSSDLTASFQSLGINWDMRTFNGRGPLAGIARLFEIGRRISPNTRIIHARSDIPAVSASFFNKAPILWDVRGLWADQKAFLEVNPIKRRLIKSARILEGIASYNASAMSTLTHSVVTELERRHNHLPELRIVVPTSVDLDRFQFIPRILSPFRGLYSGTYNNYYDLSLSKRFVGELRKISDIEVHWARPTESPREKLNAGETSIFVIDQRDMAKIVAGYSFGLAICRIDAGPSLKGAVPTKIAEFLGSGKPIVVNAGLGDLDDYLEEFDAGVILDGTQADLKTKAHHLIDLMKDPGTPSRCRALAEKYFDMDKGAENYFKLYEAM